MKIAIACDHSGFPLKQTVIDVVNMSGHEVVDLGSFNTLPVDYPDLAEKMGKIIQKGEADRGVLMCGSGIGMNIAANKIKGVFAAICHDTYSARQGVEHDNMNVICVGARVIGPALASEIIMAFLNARFIGNDPGKERYALRVNKVNRMDLI